MTEARLAAPDNTESQKSRIVYESVKFTHPGLLKSYEAIEGTLRQVSAERGVDLIDVSGEMDGRDEFFVDHVHLTREGSEELARITAQKLANLIRLRIAKNNERPTRGYLPNERKRFPVKNESVRLAGTRSQSGG